MKTKITDDLKADLPQTKWGKVLSATPVVMTIIATMLAALASSEMTRAQYDRSLAAQQQSKAGDQWSYFAAKKTRGLMQRDTLDVLRSVATVRPLETADIGKTTAEVQQGLFTGELPGVPAALATDENVKAALDALDAGKPESEISTLLAKVKDETLAETLRITRERANAFDAALKPVSQAVDQIEKSHADASPDAARSLTAARLRFNGNRYDAEARLNQAIANVLELQVRKNNLSAERHHQRSGRFFYGMLVAQAGVIISTFAIAARKRNLLWSLAAAAGAVAVSFAVYVYVCM
jgi:hypothetical protein